MGLCYNKSMKNYLKIIIVILVIIVLGTLFYFNRTKSVPINEEIKIVAENGIKGCYVATLGKDVYTLTILSQQGESFEGTLKFKNFEKDSSSGTFNGTYKDGILLGDYSFQSEGMDSVMQVIFKKIGDDFIRGYGDVNANGNRFTNINDITYDQSAIFKVSEVCATPQN